MSILVQIRGYSLEPVRTRAFMHLTLPQHIVNIMHMHILIHILIIIECSLVIYNGFWFCPGLRCYKVTSCN